MPAPSGRGTGPSEFGRRAVGTWEPGSPTRTETVRAHCGVGCGLTLPVQDNEIVKVTAPLDGPVTQGSLCSKGRFGYEHVQNRD